MAYVMGVYRSCLIMLEAASPTALDAYAEGIRYLSELHPQSWGHIALADINMRFEYFDRMLEDLDGCPKGYEATRPWNYVLTQCAYGKSTLEGHDWWNATSSMP
jgi:hypothetical protein